MSKRKIGHKFTITLEDGTKSQAEVLRQYIINELADKLTDIYAEPVPTVDIEKVEAIK